MDDSLRVLWDFDNPAVSEARFRDACIQLDPPASDVAATQLARALGLQGRFSQAHQILDGLRNIDPQVRCRRHLERGRLFRSAGDVDAARPHFRQAADIAADAGLDEDRVDALHMLALVAPAHDQVALHHEALDLAAASTDPGAQRWRASLLNNLGMLHADRGDFDAALPLFEQALAERQQQGDADAVRVARWMIGWTLRHLGQLDEAHALQTSLKAEWAAAGKQDPYVDEELALLEDPSGSNSTADQTLS